MTSSAPLGIWISAGGELVAIATASHIQLVAKFEFSILNGNLMVSAGHKLTFSHALQDN